MKESYLPTLLQMRLLVGFLDERAQCAWWPTAFYEASSRLFLEPVFSKTSRIAQYHGVLEAARQLQDEHLSVGEELGTQALQSKEAELDALKRLAATIGTSSLGPTEAGGIKDIDSTDTLRAIAAAYLSAFTQNAKTYPYLVG